MAISTPQKVVGQRATYQRVEKYSDTGLLFKLSDRALAVCHIALENCIGTGFLIGKDLIMTNNHVIDSKETAHQAADFHFKRLPTAHGVCHFQSYPREFYPRVVKKI